MKAGPDELGEHSLMRIPKKTYLIKVIFLKFILNIYLLIYQNLFLNVKKTRVFECMYNVATF